MPKSMRTGSGGTKKIGRNKRKPGKIRYTLERRWIKNKIKKIKKHLKQHPNWKPTNLSTEVAAGLK